MIRVRGGVVRELTWRALRPSIESHSRFGAAGPRPLHFAVAQAASPAALFAARAISVLNLKLKRIIKIYRLPPLHSASGESVRGRFGFRLSDDSAPLWLAFARGHLMTPIGGTHMAKSRRKCRPSREGISDLPALTMGEKLAPLILAREGVAAIWALQVAAADAHRTAHPYAAATLLEIADAVEEAWLRAEGERVFAC